MTGTLDGIRVVDLTTVILGPWAAQTLGDMGADVIKIETPNGDTTRHMGPKKNSGMGSLFMSTNRNKRSIVLDLKTREGKDALLRIVDSADVFMHNMRPKVAKKLELSYERFTANRCSRAWLITS
jgi:crotonobetainyl-CoA:carnitine CoA-transferase CaiB-like acyl-CoA transferase